MHHGRVVLRQLARTRLAAQLAHGLDERKNAIHARMHAGQAAAVGVDGQPPAGGDAATLHKRPALALGAEAQILQEQDGVDGERVVDLGHVHVFCLQPRHRKGLDARLRGAGGGQVGHAGNLPVPDRRGIAQHVDRGPRQIARTIGPCEHDGAAAVGHQAAVAHGERAGNGPRGQHLIDGERVAHEGLGVLLRPGARGHGHLGQLGARGAKLVHMARGGQRIGRDGQHRLVGIFVGLRVQKAPRGLALLAAEGGRALRAAVAHQHGLALPGLQRADRRQQVGNEAAAAYHGAVHIGRVDAQVLDHRHGPHAGVDAAGRQAVDVLHGQTGVCDGCLRGAHQERHVVHARRLAAAIGGSAGNRHAAAQVAVHGGGVEGGLRNAAHAAPPCTAGVNSTRPRPSFCATWACTRRPMVTSSGARPSTRLIMRTPSSRSISATL